MKKIRKSQAVLNLPTLTLEGSLFLPDQLAKAALGNAQWQTDADYELPKGLKLKDEYSRAFQIACAQWKHFASQLERSDVDAAVLTNTFVHELLRDVFGYSHLQASSGIRLGERDYPVSFMAGSVPVVVAPHTLALFEADTRFAVSGSGMRKKSAFMLMQELLNASAEHLWGITCNGKTLRLLRYAATLTRPSFLEVDLADLLGGQRYAEFANIWRLFHASRASGQPTECIWEKWRTAGQEEGTRVRDGLRVGVTDALLRLGEGFIQHPANEALRSALHEGTLTKDAYFQQLLRLIYRLIFVFSVEERGLLHPKDDSKPAQAARRAYAEGYALARLRDVCLKRRANNRFDDHWQAVRIIFKGLSEGEPRLALPALGGLFAHSQCPALDAASLDNAHLLAAIKNLRWATHNRVLAPVDYRNMGPEELGSVYESLLELVPDIDLPARRFGFVGLTSEGSTAGNARKLTGSYYTPDSLVQELIKSALNPVIEQRIAAQPHNPVEALLSIRVIDPACGSGHFLLAAARRLAEKLALLRASDGVQSEQDFRHALRDVVSRCIFGVDRNPMAIELARTALWLEGFEEGQPLGFLDHHLQVGDALLGLTDLKVLEKGIAKDAFKPLSGDDKDVCKQLVKINSNGLKQFVKDFQGKQRLLDLNASNELKALQSIEALPENTTKQIATKETAYRAFLEQVKTGRLAHAADVMVGAYLLPKREDRQSRIPTSVTLYFTLQADELPADHNQALAAAQAACAEARVFHWPLAFPQVFAGGGFDCVLGNPPWERIKLQEEEFFATRHRDVAEAKNKAERSQRIQWLSEGMLAKHLFPQQEHPPHECEAEQRLYAEFIGARRTAEAASLFAHVKGDDGGRYPLTGVGDVNTYALFAETISQITHASGRAGFIVPTGIATDDSTKDYFGHITQTGRLISLFDIENREKLFAAVDSRMKFCLLTLGAADQAEFVCFATQVSQLADTRRRFTLTPDEFRLINPNTLTCPVFRSERDAELTKKLYRAAPVLINENQPEGNPWGIQPRRAFDMAKAEVVSECSKYPQPKFVTMYEAKLIHQFDHRWATYTPDGNSRDLTSIEKFDPDYRVTPRYWVRKSEVEQSLNDKGWPRGWLMGWRDICRATDERTIIASVVPRVGTDFTLRINIGSVGLQGSRYALLLANLNSLVLDFTARQKIGGTHLADFIIKQLPVIPPTHYSEVDAEFIVPRVLELTYTAYDLKPWAQDLGYNGEPFAFDPKRRAVLRAELDAYYAKLYSLTHDELRYILDPADVMGEDYPSETFRVLKNKEMKEFGEYRTQWLVLDAWDKLERGELFDVAPVTMPTPRRRMPYTAYFPDSVPCCDAEDWLAGLVCDLILQAGQMPEQQIHSILLASIETEYSTALEQWRTSERLSRLPLVMKWLHQVFATPVGKMLEIKQHDSALTELLGDERTKALATQLLEAYQHQQQILKALDQQQATTTETAALQSMNKRA
ncbi:Eco57I restriction-modification methylase domain-containing protein [Agitococcus lubricus]|uniref:site-specific DNA-methyltransferase (adenine-specific) n=1 Tax=Agitococcus lubricus TaxID=1077255 RepID=A0A2T5ITH5_9GAMM|nr:N-6 DNA methylase [Agitococcus lubricus]PTQ87169.1 N-6 DNA methylase [Agitococcus lubricus]